MAALRFVVLGPVQAEVDGCPVPIARAQRRAILAYLLLHRDQTVSADELIDALWGPEPPATARTQVFAAVSAVRRALRGAGQDPVTSSVGGYRLSVGDAELDLTTFLDRVGSARALADRSAPDAAEAMREALGLWQGVPLSGITGAFVEVARSRLHEHRVEALEQLSRYELAAGRHQAVLPELTELAATYPYSEALAGNLMLALHRSGRSAEALSAFREIRRRLVTELGIEPTSDLHQLHTRILADDAALRLPSAGAASPGSSSRPSATPAPRQFLPRDIPDFVGRTTALDWLDTMADETGATSGAAIVSTLGGVAGVGKTALAVHWAHRSTERYPDGQLYLDLRGYDARDPMGPAEALTWLLRALDVPPHRIPPDVEQMAAVYRSTITGRRILVLLDNVRSAEQVRPLLPAGPGAFALLTSRDALGGLVARDGARRLALEVLPEADAVELLAHVLGADRVEAEPEAAAELAAACGHLPLALRIAAANLVGTPERSLAAFWVELEAGTRVPALAVEGDPQSDLTQVFAHSYRALSEPARRMFRLLGLIPGTDCSGPAAQALADDDGAAALLAELAEAHLVTPAAGAGRYVMPDLLREYASRLAGAPDHAAERRAALDRYATWADSHVQSASALVYPSSPRWPAAGASVAFDDAETAGRWLADELGNLTALVFAAADLGRPELAWRIPYACRDYLFQRSGQALPRRLGEAALTAATRASDPLAIAAAELVLAQAHNMVGHDPCTLEHATRCLHSAEQAGWPHVRIDAYNAISVHHFHAGDLRSSADAARRAFDLSRELGVPSNQHLGKLGLVSLLLGDLAVAAGYLERTLASQAGLANHSRGITLLNLSEAYRLLGRPADAHAGITEAITLFEQVGNRHLAAVARCGLVIIHLADGHTPQACREAEAARAALDESDDLLAQTQMSCAYGLAAVADGRHDEALAVLRDGLRLARTLPMTHPAVQLAIALGRARRAAGESDGVDRLLADAAEQARAGQFAVLEAEALDVLTATHLDRGDTGPAGRAAHRAMDLAERTGLAGLRFAPAAVAAGRDRNSTVTLRST
ncbi:BTAD domain-containing putative transcriptional regulator [Cryptosporangium sp. NPDC051539]|uniref:AfsR/SARP family transcriptional regulator n=1 Tax=Cryptosporangium sp. NPDC051539 TaxID=3363962 RepID=UPI0037A60F03